MSRQPSGGIVSGAVASRPRPAFPRPFQRLCEGILVLTPAFGLYFGTPVLSEEVFGALIVLHPRASSSWDYD
jgi:hypothetical protein